MSDLENYEHRISDKTGGLVLEYELIVKDKNGMNLRKKYLNLSKIRLTYT